MHTQSFQREAIENAVVIADTSFHVNAPAVRSRSCMQSMCGRTKFKKVICFYLLRMEYDSLLNNKSTDEVSGGGAATRLSRVFKDKSLVMLFHNLTEKP